MNPEELQQFFSQLPPELQQKVMLIEDEQKRMTVLASLYQRYLQQQGQVDSGGQDPNLSQSPEYGVDPNQLPQDSYSPEEMGQVVAMKYGGRSMRRAQEGLNTPQQGQQEQPQYVPVEAERNESVYIPTGETPYTEDGFLEPLSTNPITGASNYEIPKDRDNQSHEERNHLTGQQGINMELPEGSVVYSDKTKLPYEFKIGKRNFEGKTFKAAADYVSKLEKDAEKKIKALEENGELDDIAQQTFEFNFAKYGKYRQELNDLQETVLDLKKQTEVNEESNKFMAQYGANIKKLNKANENYLQAYDQYSNSKAANPNTKKVLKARDGLNASIAGMDKLMADMQSNPDLPIGDLTSRAKMYGLMQDSPSVPIQGGKALKPKSTIEPFSYTPTSDTLQQFKQGIAGIESSASKDPYAAHNKHTSEGTWGKYQFVWSLWKNEIAKKTGIKSPQEWVSNPAAQEQFMDYYVQSHLMPAALRLKQKYQMPFNVYEIMAGIHLEGEGKPWKGKNEEPKGFLGKYMAGQLNKSSMAGSFKNMDTQSYMQQFAQFPNEAEMRYGGRAKMYADNGVTAKSPFTLWQGDKNPPKQPGLNTPGYSVDDLDWINRNVFSGQATDNASIQRLLFDKYKEEVGTPVKRFYAGQLTDEDAKYDERLGDDANIPVQYFLNKYRTAPVNPPQPSAGSNIPLPSTLEETVLVEDNQPWYKADADSTYIPRYESLGKPSEEAAKVTAETPQGDPSKPNWLQYLNYGVNKSLPALDALSLMMEKTIPPTLQQKRARYTPLSTDVDINPQLNEAQRLYASTQADTRGNPSVRAARLAQINANAQGNMNQTLAQKYNMEQQLRNQEVMRADQYYNQLDDVNMGLRKRYETETLQTAENKRQQSTQARQYMMNLKLREDEQNKAMKLALMNTNYDYDPITGEFRTNEGRKAENWAYQTQVMKYQNLLSQQQKLQEEMKLAASAAEKKSLEQELKETQDRLKELEQTPRGTTKRLGGKVKAKTNPSDLMPTINYKKYFPM